jgi:hypothetical protein
MAGCESDCKQVDSRLVKAINNSGDLRKNLKSIQYDPGVAMDSVRRVLSRDLTPECYACLLRMESRLSSLREENKSVKVKQREEGKQISKGREKGGSKSKKTWLVNMIPGRTPGIKTGHK